MSFEYKTHRSEWVRLSPWVTRWSNLKAKNTYKTTQEDMYSTCNINDVFVRKIFSIITCTCICPLPQPLPCLSMQERELKVILNQPFFTHSSCSAREREREKTTLLPTTAASRGVVATIRISQSLPMAGLARIEGDDDNNLSLRVSERVQQLSVIQECRLLLLSKGWPILSLPENNSSVEMLLYRLRDYCHLQLC